MLGLLAFIVSIVAVVMSFFDGLVLASFALSILGIIMAVISGYDKDTVEKAQKEEKTKKESRALEIGAIIISGAAILSYYVFLIINR